jgi:teichuronic acid biosynthesis glycosyltransferase TuaC
VIRILTLSTLFPDSSRPVFGPFVERQTLEIASCPGVEVQVVAPIGVPVWPFRDMARYARFDAVPARETWKGLTVHRPRFTHWPATSGRFDAGSLARALLPLLRDLRGDFPFDVIDAQFFFPDGPAAVRLGAALGVPVSIKARGADIHHWGRNPATAAQVLDAARRADAMLAVSGALRADMVALGMPEDRIAVHYTGVDLDRFAPCNRAHAKRALGIDGALIVSVGALIPRKGQAILIDALADLPDATLVLIGEGADRAALEARASVLGLADRVRLPGSLDADSVAEWLAAADVMALASSSEGLANAWVEALACGTPIVITGAGGAYELVDRPEAGRIVDRTPAAFADAIRDLLAEPPDQDAVRRTAERFTWGANADRLLAHLRAILR